MSSMNRKQLINELKLVLRDSSVETVMLHQAVADSLGLNITCHQCTGLISRFGPMTAGKLAELTGLTTGAITGVIDRLEKAGYAKRVPNLKDRRVILVVLTPKAEKIKKLFSPLSQKIEKVLEVFTDEQLTFILEFVTIFTKISQEVASELRNK